MGKKELTMNLETPSLVHVFVLVLGFLPCVSFCLIDKKMPSCAVFIIQTPYVFDSTTLAFNTIATVLYLIE